MQKQKSFTPLESRIFEHKNGIFLRGFVLIELLTVIAIIVLLTAILIPAAQLVKKQANTAACQSNLRQWSLYFSMYTEDNKDRFFIAQSGTNWRFWGRVMKPYYRGSDDLWLCPMATVQINPTGEEGVCTIGGKSLAWGRFQRENRDLYGSYGVNLWLCDNRCTSISCWHQQCWKTRYVKGAGNIPVFLDCMMPGSMPDSLDGPPELEDLHAGKTGNCWMSHFCINRHDGIINCLFMDWSVRKIGLKELWTLKWHRSFNTAGQWTKTGGVLLEEWPEWMRNFKEY